MNRHLKFTLLPSLFIGVLTLVVFQGCLDNEFVNFDDAIWVFANKSIQSLQPAAIFKLFTSFDNACYVPLSRLSIALDYAIWGQNPFGYHFVNILLHSINAGLVFLICRKLLREASKGGLSAEILNLPAGIAALFFSLHPLRVESVAWASERRDVLAGLFTLLSTLAYLQENGTYPAPVRPSLWRKGATVLFFCALLSKANEVGLPLIFLFLDVYPLGRIHQGKQGSFWRQILPLAKEKGLMVAGAVLASVLAILGQQGKGALANTQLLDLKTRLAMSMVSSVHYLEKIFFPRNLNVLYLLNKLYSWQDPSVWFGLFLMAGLSVLFLGIRHRWQAPIWIWLSYLALIGPFLGLMQIGRAIAADRYTYLSSIPVAIGFGSLFEYLWNRLKTLSRETNKGIKPIVLHVIGRWGLFLATGAILASLAIGTIRQVRVWRNSESLWRHSLSLDPGNPFAWRNLSDALQNAGKGEQAIHCAQQAVHLFPEHPEHWYDLGGYCLALNRFPEALSAYCQCVRLDPGFREAYHNMGVAYLKQGKPEKALESLFIARKLGNSPATTFTLGCCHEQLGELDAAMQEYREAAQEGVADAWIHWGELAARNGKIHESMKILQEGIQRTRHPKIEIAFVESALSILNPEPWEIKAARQILFELVERTQGKSQRVILLQQRMTTWPEPQKP